MPTDAQPTPRRRPSRGGLKVLAVGLLMLVPLLYVASVGPAYRLAIDDDGFVDLDVYFLLRDVYAPLWSAARRWPWAERAMWWYTGCKVVRTWDD
jgi:hypothetical protein